MYLIKKSYIVLDCSSHNLLTLSDQNGNNVQIQKFDVNGFEVIKPGDFLYLIESINPSSELKTQIKQFFIAKTGLKFLLT